MREVEAITGILPETARTGISLSLAFWMLFRIRYIIAAASNVHSLVDDSSIRHQVAASPRLPGDTDREWRVRAGVEREDSSMSMNPDRP